MTIRHKLLCGASMLGATLISSLTVTGAQAADASANTAASADTTVGDVVIVAEKREEKLESVPVAVTAFTAQQRALVGIKSIQDMTNFTPGLAYNSIANRPYIRGIGRNTDNLATASAVAIYYNGVYDGANANTILQHDDLFIDTIEVDRGPQNALHGSNSDGGTINYVSKKPTSSFFAEGRVGVENYDEYYGEAAVSGPLSDNVRFRVGGNYTSNGGGYFHNLDGPPQGGNIAQGNSGTSHYVEAQLAANFDKLDLWGMVSSGDYSTNYHTTAIQGAIPISLVPNGSFSPSNFYGLCGLPGVAAANPNPAPLGTKTGCITGDLPTNVLTDPVVASSFPGNNPSTANPRDFIQEYTSTNQQNDDVALAYVATYHFPNADLTYLGGYQTFNYVLNFTTAADSGVKSFQLPGPATASTSCINNAGSLGYSVANCTAPLTINAQPSTTLFIEKDRFFSHELNYSSTDSGPFQYLLGLYWYHENYEQPVSAGVMPTQTQLAHPVYWTALGAACPGSPTVSLCAAPANPTSAISTSDTTLRYDSVALFAQGDYKFNDEWKVSGAIRYTDDRKTGYQTWRFEEFDNSSSAAGNDNLNYGANTPAIDFTPAAVPTVAYAGAGVPFIDPATGDAVRNLAATWSAFTGEGGVDWTPDSSTLAYFKYSRGYKSGGFSTFTIAPNPETKAESVDAFEIGAKKSIGSTFTTNIAAFYYDYTNDQIPLSVQNASTGLIAAQLFNLPLVVNYGVELEGIWKPIDPLQLSLQYSYLSAKVVNAPCFEDTVDPLALQPGAAAAAAKCPTQLSATAVVQSLKGDQLPQAAPNKVSFNALYTLDFDPGKLVLSGTYVWKDKTYDSLFNRPYAASPAYSQVNLRATWIGANGRYNIIAFVDNVFNTLGYDGTTGSELLPIVAGGPEAVVRNPSFTAPRTFGVEFQYRFR